MVVIGYRRLAFLGLCLGSLGLLSATAAYGEIPAEEPNAQDELWSRFKNVKAGPLTFDFSGQARLRYEYDDGFSVKGFGPGTHDQLLLTRLRPELGIVFWDRPKLFLQLQDAHVLLTRLGEADFPQSNPLQGPPSDIRQLYVQWLNIGGSVFGFRVGRQQISYGDQRVFGPGNWGNTGRFSWDAAMLKVDTRWFWTDAWVGRYLVYQPDVWPSRSIDNLVTAVAYTHIKNLPFRLELFYALRYDYSGKVPGESGTGNLLSHTIGLQAEGHAFEVLDGGATFAGQFGSYGRDRLRAFGANGNLGVTLPVAWKPQLRGQLTWGSGDKDPHDGVHGTFDGVFGGRDIYFYGYLNLFFWANIWDSELEFNAHPFRNVTAYIEYHHFNLSQARDAWYTTGLAASRRDDTGSSGTTLGDELDLRVVWTLWKHLEIMGGFGHLFPGAFVRNTGTATPANWYFAQTAYFW
jgi:hypothetical protein